jgi:hypothetical protein
VSESPWRLSWRADPAVAALADRHYSRKTVGAAQFAPPGPILVLRSADRTAGWVTLWPRPEYADMPDWAGAWMNTFFRNEGDGLSSDLIRRAVAHSRYRWPDVPPLGMVTLIDPSKIRHKRDPGRCYLKAGFRHAGYTKSGHRVLQLLPADMPEPERVPGSQDVLFALEAS